jgi:hypothetical protein
MWDIGEFSPYLLSSTVLLHKLSWRGINVDLDEKKIKEFHQYRPHDSAVSENSRKMKVLEHANAAIDSCVELNEITSPSACGERASEMREIQTTTLTQIINASPYAGCQIQYLNVDVEGLDLAVRKGFDFNECRPRVIHRRGLGRRDKSSFSRFSRTLSYKLSSVEHTTLFVVRQS